MSTNIISTTNPTSNRNRDLSTDSTSGSPSAIDDIVGDGKASKHSDPRCLVSCEFSAAQVSIFTDFLLQAVSGPIIAMIRRKAWKPNDTQKLAKIRTLFRHYISNCLETASFDQYIENFLESVGSSNNPKCIFQAALGYGLILLQELPDYSRLRTISPFISTNAFSFSDVKKGILLESRCVFLLLLPYLAHPVSSSLGQVSNQTCRYQKSSLF